MATIRAGYGGKPTHIRVSSRGEGERKAEFWIEQEGAPRFFSKEVNGVEVWEKSFGHSETLAYATLDELLTLRGEITNVIREIVG